MEHHEALWNTNGTPMGHQKLLKALITKEKRFGVPKIRKCAFIEQVCYDAS
jgi:hypothetical protein